MRTQTLRSVLLAALAFAITYAEPVVAQSFCAPSPTTACLNHGRFRVEVAWIDHAGNQGAGNIVPSFADDSTIFWFFAPENWEMLVKVLDGCALNQKYWVFSAGITDVGYTVTVTDTVTGVVKHYENQIGTPATTVTDTSAFAGCPVVPATNATTEVPSRVADAEPASPWPMALEDFVPSTSCLGGDTVACLHGNRFKIEVDWTDFSANSGKGHVVPLAVDDSAMIWFFGPSNYELMLKTLDGCGLNNRFWFFATGATTVGYTVHVTDTFTGQTHDFAHAAGAAAAPLLDTSFFATCAASGPPRIQFQSESTATLTHVGDRVHLAVTVQSADGSVIRDAAVTWTSSHPESVLVQPDGPLSAYVQAVAEPPAQSVVQARYQSSMADALVTVASLNPRTVLIDTDLVLSRTASSVSLKASPVSLLLRPGDIVLNTGDAGLLERVLEVHQVGDSLLLATEPASLTDAFEKLSISILGPPAPQSKRSVISRDVASSKPPSAELSIVDSLQCKGLGPELIHPSGLNLNLEPPQLRPFLDCHVDVGLFSGIHLKDCSFGMTGSMAFDFALGQLDLQQELGGGVECILPLGRFDIPAATFYKLINIGIPLEASVGFSVKAAVVGPSVSLKGPGGFARATLTAGLAYSSGTWRAISDFNWTKNLHLFSFDHTPPELTADFELFARLDTGLSASTGIGRFSVDLATFQFAELQGGTYLHFGLPAPLDPKNIGYKGPSWEVGLHGQGSLKAELSSGGAKKFLDWLGIPTAIPGELTLIDAKLPVLISPQIYLSADKAQVDVGKHEEVVFQALAQEGLSGSIDFSGAKSGARTAVSLASGDYGGGAGRATWVPTSGDIGAYDITARVTADLISKLVPYASQNALKLAVVGSSPTASPTITRVSPSPVTGSDSPQEITIYGSGFAAGATATLRDLTNGGLFSKPTTLASPGQLTLTARFSNNTATWSVQIANPNGALSNSKNFLVEASPNPSPSVSGVSPNPFVVGTGPQTLTITGTNFKAGATATLTNLTDGGGFVKEPTVFVDQKTLTLSVSFANQNGSWTATVTNSDGTSSNAYGFLVQAHSTLSSVPTITSVSPSAIMGSNSAQVLNIYGANFVAGANIILRDLSAGQVFTNHPSSYLSSSQITISHNFSIAAHSWSVEVINPDGQSSGQFQFQVVAPSGLPPPVISSVSPNPVTGSNSQKPFTIFGNNFVNNANVVLRDLSAGQTFPNRPSSFFSATQIVLNPSFSTAAHAWSVEVINPDGQSSGQFQFQVVAPSSQPPPVIGSVSPNPVTGSNSQQPFTILGNNFVNNANVILRDLSAGQTFLNRPSSFFSATQIVLNPNFTTAAHTWSVEVINPDGQSSGQFQFQVVAPSSQPPPIIGSVSPNPVTGSNSQQPFTILGNNFVNNANVVLRDLSAGQTFLNRPSSFFSATQIVLNPNFTTAAHTWSVEVINPDGQSSGQFQFQVVAPSSQPPPVIGSVSPNPVTGSNSQQRPFTILGSNFVSGANIILRDLSAGQTFPNRQPSSFSSSQIVINPNFTTAAHTWSVEVINPDGQSSGQFQFQVVAPSSQPPPVISSVSPNPVTGSNSQQPFTILGSNFISGANIILRDLSAGQTFPNRQPSSFSSSQIVINPNFTTAAHTWSVEVINPDGQSSGQFQFQVVARSSQPPPVISSVSPNPVTGSNSQQPFTILGSNFISGANIILRDLSAGQTFPNRQPSSFGSSQIVINPNFTTAAHTWSIEIINPDGQSSGQFQFQVVAPSSQPPPVISSVSPNPVTGSNSQQPFTILGSNFVSGANIVLRDLSAGQTFPNRPPSSFSSSQIVINPNFTTAAHTWSVEVINPDGQSSGQFQFQVTSPAQSAPSISSVSPNPVTGSNSQKPFTIFGNNFVSGANIVLRDLSAGQTFPNRPPSSFSSSQIVINPNFTTAAHTWSVEVINPDGQSSGQFQFQVTSPAQPAPSISSVSPNPVTGSNSQQSFTIFGNNFVSGANIVLRDLSAGQTFPNRPPSSFSSSQIVINPNFTTAAHTWSVEVINPDGQSSGQFQFQVTSPAQPAPSISSVSPNPVRGSNSQQPFTIFGNNFVSGANIVLRDLSAGQTFPNRQPSSFSSNQIVINPNFTTAAHTWSVEVINPNSQSTGQFQFQVN